MTDRRSYDTEFIERLTRIEEQMTRANARLDKINGSVRDYQQTKERVIEICDSVKVLDKDMCRMEDEIDKEFRPLITNIQIKLYTITGLVALISGGIGSGIGALIVKFGVGG